MSIQAIQAATSFNLPIIPSLPNLVSQILVNQQGFDVDLGEHPGIHTKSLSVFHYHYWAKQ